MVKNQEVKSGVGLDFVLFWCVIFFLMGLTFGYFWGMTDYDKRGIPQGVDEIRSSDSG